MEVDSLYFELMLNDLQNCFLEVTTTPGTHDDEDRKIRAVSNQNPDWYKELCKKYPRNRRNRKSKFTDSYVKRGRIIKYLEELINGNIPNAREVDDLIEIAKQMADTGNLNEDEIRFFLEYGKLPEEWNEQF